MNTYECVTCKRSVTVEDPNEAPNCCGKRMRKKKAREICLQPAHAAHARPMEDEEACDEFHAGT